VIEFSIDKWIDDGPNVCAEERATLCDLKILVDGRNACVFSDRSSGEIFDCVTIPAVHVANGIATDWWMIFGGREHEHPIWPWRIGYALPDLSFCCNGSTVEIVCKPFSFNNPDLDFYSVENATVRRDEVESALSRFVGTVIERLEDRGVGDSDLDAAWSRVSQSRDDRDERVFCEAASALGADPYAISDADASIIEQASELFSEEALPEFLAGISNGNDLSSAGRHQAVERELEWVQTVERRSSGESNLPGLHEAARQVEDAAKWRDGERAWMPGYRVARALRRVLDINDEKEGLSYKEIGKKLGCRNFKKVRRNEASGIDALVSRDNGDARIHLQSRGSGKYALPGENFSFARAVGDAVCYPRSGRSVVNRLKAAERQALGRAFAAEFLAPVQKVLDMSESGRNEDEIARTFQVSPMVIERQIENRDNIVKACSA